ncbi:MAG: hypothetical protein M3P28_00695 [Thermoproteota archaeon]|nr:hypothetical protein [Thermoproteota archaeon]
MSTKLEQNTFAGKSMQAWKDQVTKAGLVLKAPVDLDSGDYPDRIYSSLRHFRRNIAITKNHKKIITTMSRQLVTTKDDKGSPGKDLIFGQEGNDTINGGPENDILQGGSGNNGFFGSQGNDYILGGDGFDYG